MVWSIGRLERRGLECVPLVGGIGSGSVNWHANAIAQRLAECSGGSCYILNAPVIVQSRESRDMLVREPDIAAVLEKGAEMRRRDRRDRPDPSWRSTTAQSGALSARDIERLKAEGAVASVCTSYLDRRGRVLDLELCERSIGQTLGQLDRCRTIALAIGRSKVASIRAALSSGYIDVFITDLETARATIEEPED